MNCLQSRRILLATPRERSPEHQRHVDACAECTAFGRQMTDLDRQIDEAVMVPPPDALSHRILLTHGHNPMRQYAAAAIVAGFAAFIGLFAGHFLDPEFGDTVDAVGPTHPAVVAIAEVVDERPVFVQNTRDPVELEQGLKRLGLALRPGEASARYVGKCHIDGSASCDHIVVTTADAHANVMLVPDSPLPERVLVADRHMVALVNPTGRGGYIVVADSARTAKRMEKLFVKG